MNPLEKVGEMVDAHFDDGTSDLRLAEGRRRFIDAVARQPLGAARPRRFALLSWSPLAPLTSLALMTVVILLVVDKQHENSAEPRPHAASPEGNAMPVMPKGDVVRLETSRDQSGATVHLESGASVTLSSHTRGESRKVGSRSYLVVLDYGRMTFTIDPRAATKWVVQAGAYKVRVVGTVFTVVSDPDREAVEVRVDRGRVEIRSAGEGGGLDSTIATLGAGGTLRAIGGDVTVERPPAIGGDETVDRPDATEKHAPLPTAAPTTTPTTRTSTTSTARTSTTPTATPTATPTTRTSMPSKRSVDAGAQRPGIHDWIALYDAGDYAGAWRGAQANGYGRLIATLDVTRLSHLADAARLAGDGQGARSTLGALRRRFPGAREATDAAFLLGRLAAEMPSGLADAARWFETYLGENPKGLYAQEAEGRLIVVHRRSGRLANARDAARGYLGRYPGGPYSNVARSVLNAPD